jgi:ribosomal protein S18 acetylase RimI-like enzyme
MCEPPSIGRTLVPRSPPPAGAPAVRGQLAGPRQTVAVSVIRVRDAVLADLDVVVVGGAAREYREQLTRHFIAAAAGDGAVMVAESDAKVVGRAFLERWGDPPAAWLGGLLVEEEHRRRGVATAIVHYAEERAVELGYRELRLSVDKDNAPAQALYDGLGYKRVGEDTSAGLVLSDGTVVHPPEAVWVMVRELG